MDGAATTPSPTPPVRRNQPHQVALWFAIGFFALTFLGPMVFGTYFLSERYLAWMVHLVRPGIWLAQQLRLGIVAASLTHLLFAGLAFYVAFYVPVKIWMTASRRLRITMVSILLTAGFLYLLGNWHFHRVDWTSHGLNPNRPGFEPQVVVLAGTFDYWFKDPLLGGMEKSGSAQFEIRMRGANYYYCRKWRGSEWRVGSWFRVEIATNGSGYSWGLASMRHTTRGTGGSWNHDNLLTARMWEGDVFRGGTASNLVAYGGSHASRAAEYKDLVNVGRWQIPTHIRLTEGNQRIENYQIRRIEFWPKPDPNWFGQIIAKYADRSPEFRNADLGEPGVAPGKRH